MIQTNFGMNRRHQIIFHKQSIFTLDVDAYTSATQK